MCGALSHHPCFTFYLCASDVSLIRIPSVCICYTGVSIGHCHLRETFASVVFGEEDKRGNIRAQRSLEENRKEKKEKGKSRFRISMLVKLYHHYGLRTFLV